MVCCYTPPEVDIPIEPRATKNSDIVFGSFNKSAKLSDQTIALWARLLKQVSDVSLILKDRAFSDLSVSKQTQERFAKHGIAPERIEFVGRLSHAEHFAYYNRIDIALDPTPYGGATTTADALWMGTPVVTLRGTWVGRVSRSILEAIGRSDLVANDESEYLIYRACSGNGSCLARYFNEKLALANAGLAVL
ncbi:O-linked N-acetylglucosamine transferase family protein [Thiorhodovibrio litoralis]|uniref:O-linked N-acetylglucosamine transferase family protein n=1 Tax=Thiorhodovibrio litoralis TaxID=2952932 RepID=UPI002B2639CD|nr:hypothetical protein [Thiorhodovibrio litoralis]WPL14654.1 putative O-linked N-acetylglucosamine transferase, SPINDLY family [Thiorhodovibrio litoralis]